MTRINSDFISPKKRFDIIVQHSVQEVLKRNNFKKNGNNFLYKNDLYKVVTLCKSKWNSSDRLSFIVRWGVFVPNSLIEIPDPKVISEVDCQLRGNLSGMSGNTFEDWIDLSTDDRDPDEKDQETINFLGRLLEDSLLPFFNALQNVDDLIDLLEQDINGKKVWENPHSGLEMSECLARLYWLKGDQKKSCAVIDQEIKSTQWQPALKKLNEIRESIINTSPPIQKEN